MGRSGPSEVDQVQINTGVDGSTGGVHGVDRNRIGEGRYQASFAG